MRDRLAVEANRLQMHTSHPYFLKLDRRRFEGAAQLSLAMETLLICGRYYDSERRMWKNCWHPPAVCIGCDSIRHTRSAAAGLKTRTSYGKLPPAISRIIFTFVDWEEVYESNLKLLFVPSYSEAIRRPKRMPSAIELEAYAATLQKIHGHRSV